MSETTSVAEDLGSEGAAAPAVDPPEAPPSRRETMEAAFDAVQERGDQPEGEAKPAPEGEPAPARQRGPDGKFAPKPADAAAPAEPAAPVADIPPPEGWGDKARVDWNRLPASVRAELAKPAAADPLRAVAAEFQQDIAAVGHPPEALFRSLLVAERELRTNPVEAFKWLARSYNFDLSRLAPQPQPSAQPSQAGTPGDAEAQPWRADLTPIEQKLQAIEQRDAQRQQEALRQQQAEASREIQSFAADRPHFEAVRQDMALLVREGRAPDLAAAYNIAVQMNPQTRAALAAEQQRAAEAKTAADRASRVAEARKASSVNVRSSAGSTPAPALSRRQTMEQAFDAMQGS